MLSDAQIEEYTRDGLKPWEMLAQESLKIGQMVKEMAGEDARPHLPKEDIMCYNMSESSVVGLWNCWIGHLVDDNITTAVSFRYLTILFLILRHLRMTIKRQADGLKRKDFKKCFPRWGR